MRLIFDGLAAPVRLHNCAPLVDLLPSVLPGWPFRTEADNGQSALLSLSHGSSGYVLETPLLPEPVTRTDTVEAACAFAAELTRAYVHQDDQLLCLHAAAAEFAGKLVVFPAHYRSGKSILSACLAAAGVRLFNDDVLPIRRSDGCGISPGLALRLRNPLPDNLAIESRRFIESHTSLQGNNYSYLDLDDTNMAPRGAALPIGAFIVLEREPGAMATLEAVGQADLLHQVVWQNFAREATAPSILDALNRLVLSSQRWRLRYDRTEEAVELLQKTFQSWPETAPGNNPTAARGQLASGTPGGLAPRHYRQAPGIRVIETDRQSFLADPNGNAIHHLNPLGASLWRLFVEPITIDELASILASAFPDLEPAQARCDVDALVSELTDKNLLDYGG
jgi:hypothetical protein